MHIHIHTHTYTHTHMCAYMHTHTRVCAYACTHRHTHIHTYTDTNTHTPHANTFISGETAKTYKHTCDITRFIYCMHRCKLYIAIGITVVFIYAV